tara:strand:- start:384 stop:617 length:234 start_codon:yes stop_codon:yes gene_type:complete
VDKLKLDLGTIIKLAFYSLVVGGLLYWLEVSTGDIYGWVINKFAAIWHWLMNTGLKYMLLGATIVVPIFVISRMRKR